MSLGSPKVSRVDADASTPCPTVVYYDKDEWRNRNEALWDSFTPEMKLMMTVEGYDMIDPIPVRS
ncbi:hypothetical protein CPB86DRAFT_780721 [Serendipita vermifera]|nr:hypothetical protein CPB86DRAFT_780721 [Serendipita vermifera]